MGKPMVIISFDGLSYKDLAYLGQLPHFSRFMQSASGCKTVKTIYPSVTYPAHASIVTGCYPKTHGIVDNTYLQPTRKSPDWYWYFKSIKTETIYMKAQEKGYKVAALLWPTTAKAAIAINMPEIFANRPYKHQIPVSLCNGTIGFQYQMSNKYGHLRQGKKQPYLDDFTFQSLMEVLRSNKADLVLCHFTDLDSMRHENYFDADEAFAALRRHDNRLGEIVKALEEEPYYRDVHLVVLGDHASLNVNQALSPNGFLKERGWLKIKSPKCIQYKAIAKACDGSAYIYTQKLTLKELDALRKDLEQFKESSGGVERIFEQEELIANGANPLATFMLEAKSAYVFENSFDTPMVLSLEDHPDYRGQKLSAVHGYHPDKPDYKTVFMLMGPEVEPNRWVDDMDLVDIAPTLALLLGVELPKAEGNAVYDVLKDRECL